jgi:hypothetical protein
MTPNGHFVGDGADIEPAQSYAHQNSDISEGLRKFGDNDERRQVRRFASNW